LAKREHSGSLQRLSTFNTNGRRLSSCYGHVTYDCYVGERGI